MGKTLTSCCNFADYYRKIDLKYELNVNKVRLVTKLGLSLFLSSALLLFLSLSPTQST